MFKKNFYLDFVSYEKKVFFGLVKKIFISCIEGDIGISYGHMQLLTIIKPGIFYLMDENNKEQYIYLYDGILEIQPNITTVLSDKVILGENIDYLKINKFKKINNIK